MRSSALEGGEGDGERDCCRNGKGEREEKVEKVRNDEAKERESEEPKKRKGERTTASISSWVFRKPKGIRKV